MITTSFTWLIMEDNIYLIALNSQFLKYLDRLREELLAYSDEKFIWQTADGISNSAGTLAVHILGNLNHFIGATLGNTGYVRDRPMEFSLAFKPRHEIIAGIDATSAMMDSVIPNLSDDTLDAEFPHKFGDEEMSTHWWLIQCSTHMAYHLGQINYHRRLLDVH